MGQKTHPTGFRLGGVIDWQSQWYANNGKSYANLLNEDRYIRDIITKNLVKMEQSGSDCMQRIQSVLFSGLSIAL